MTRQAPPFDPEPGETPPTLHYAVPPQHAGHDPQQVHPVARYVFRIIFACGAALLAGGLGFAIRPNSDGFYAMAWGALLMALFGPIRWDPPARREN